MANHAILKAAIKSVIKTNGNEEITGEILQYALIALIESLGAEYQFAGIATPDTNPGTPDYNIMYIAGVGTYPNFGGTDVEKGHIGVFTYNGTWDYEVVETGAYFDFQEYPLGSAIEFTFYDSENPDGQIIKISKDVSGLYNDPKAAISQWWAAGMKMEMQDVRGFTDTFPSLSTALQSLGLFGVIKEGQVIDTITNANKLIFVTADSTEYVVTKSDLPYKALADLVSVKLESGTASNVSIHVRGENDMLISHININEIANHPAAYANAATALADVPTLYRRKGMKVVYLDDDTQLWIEMLCIDDVGGANWWTDVTDNWVIEGPIQTDQLSPTGGEQLNIAGTRRGNLDDFLNVNVWNGRIAAYSTQAAARAAVPEKKRKLGLIITYLLSTGEDTSQWVQDMFIGDDVTDWSVADNWQTIGPVSVSQTETGKSIVRIGNESTTLETLVDDDIYKFSLLKTPIRLIGWKYGQFNLSNIAVGDTFDITNIEQTTERKWIILDLKIGDIANIVDFGYHANNHGYNSYRNWVSLDENYKVLAIAETSTDWENAHAIPQPNARYYIVQTMTDVDYYVSINRLSNPVAYLNNLSDKFGHITINPVDDQHLRIIPASGKWSADYYSQTFKCNFADCALRIIPKDGQKSRVAFLKSNVVTLSQVADFSDYLGGVIEIEQESIIDIPKDAQYIYLYIGNNQTDRAYEPKLFSYIPKTINGSIDSYIANSVYSNEGTPQLVSFLTCTDLHGSQTGAKHFMDILAKYRANIAFAVHLGDSVMTDFNSDFTFWENSGMDEVINMIGNHDSAIYSNGSWSWSAKTKKECYDRYLAPYIADWGVVQPSGVDTPASDDYGACYFYKDIANVGIRFIILDAMHQDTAQETWFANVLADARTNSYSVIVMCHYQSGDVATDDTINWATIDGANAHLSDILSLDSYYSQTLHSFIQNGGDFICWFAGHRHRDDFGYQVEYSDIFNVVEEKAGCNTGANIESNYRTHDSERTINTPSQISFNFVTIDKIKKTLKIVRIGNNRDLYLRQKNTLCYNYNTKNIISQG